jgi:hypothetical protein
MAALLEGTLPIELSLTEEERIAEDEKKREDDLDEIIRRRENVFDALQIDMATLRIGKKQCVFLQCSLSVSQHSAHIFQGYGG